ncbi:hypothetical protein BA895_22560 [Humibacillus sp. DSM 29435]|uniref:GNAT family N-acetyltransferase n=1 Tax=Humibacillus sp. DSM 29435 TaxID=1869167 RepID=UPI00087313E8|nr:GNAT family protein [Humibacillus sp. DSM 29435]OFE15551.1 hypothetical protein BA895_22560 [Humibacillus sp. DSM 29435]
MIWPLKVPAEIRDGALSMRSYSGSDADPLFAALSDERSWEHIPRAIPRDAPALDAMIQANVREGLRQTFIIRVDARVVGMTSVLFDPSDPDGVEVGGTQFDPDVWGTGCNAISKRLLFEMIFTQGAQWVQLRTDERNHRSAAAIRKLGARDLGLHQDVRIRRDGTQRRSHLFRVDRPCV